MKKKTLKLNELKVQSFVTSMENADTNTVKGGAVTVPNMCETEVVACADTPVCSRFAFCMPGSAFDACPTWGCSVVIHCVTEPAATDRNC